MKTNCNIYNLTNNNITISSSRVLSKTRLTRCASGFYPVPRDKRHGAMLVYKAKVDLKILLYNQDSFHDVRRKQSIVVFLVSECYTGRCFDHGSCSLGENKTASCACKAGWVGDRCDTKTNTTCPRERYICKVGSWPCVDKVPICQPMDCALNPSEITSVCQQGIKLVKRKHQS